MIRAQPIQQLTAQQQRDLNAFLARRLFGRVTRRKLLATWIAANPQDPDPRYGYDVAVRSDDAASPFTNRRMRWWHPVPHYGSDHGQAMAIVAELRRFGVGTMITAVENEYRVRMYEYLGSAQSANPLGVVASFTGYDLAPTIAQCARAALEYLGIDQSPEPLDTVENEVLDAAL